jgi:hypothetical protein
MFSRSARLVLGCALALAQAPQTSRADEIDRCLTAHTNSQRLRQDGKLRAAREDLVTCARQVCPGLVRAECADWLVATEALIPTVVISARTPAGSDLANVRVVIDGETRAEKLDGRQMMLDPGPHTIRLEAGGYQPAVQTLLLHEREKARPFVVTLTPALSARQEAPQQSARPVPVVAYVLGGVGLVALSSFAYFGWTGRSEYFALKDRCSPSCTSSDVSPLRTKLLVADVSLGISIVALGVAAYLLLTRPASLPGRTFSVGGL